MQRKWGKLARRDKHFLWREGETKGCTIFFHDFQEMAGLSKSLTRSRDRAVKGKTAVFGLPQGRAKSH